MPYLTARHTCFKPGDFGFPDSYTAHWPKLGDVWNCDECADCWRWVRNSLWRQFKGAPMSHWVKIP